VDPGRKIEFDQLVSRLEAVGLFDVPRDRKQALAGNRELNPPLS
jgi:hypothetical protein